MALKRNCLGQKRVVCDGCGLSIPPWKAVGWQLRHDGKMFHRECPQRGSGSFQALKVLSA